MVQRNLLVAKRYAKALFAAARDSNKIDQIESELAVIGEAVLKKQNLADFFANPVFSRDQKAKILADLCKEIKVHKTTSNFLYVLAENGRAGSLADVVKEFKTLCSADRGELTAQVVSSSVLEEGQLKELSKNLEKSLGKKIIFEQKLDEAILGGLIVKIGSKMYDNSLANKLQKFEQLGKQAIAVNF